MAILDADGHMFIDDLTQTICGTLQRVFLELFKSDVYQDVSLNDWLTHLPPDFVKQHLNISQGVLDANPSRQLRRSFALGRQPAIYAIPFPPVAP